MPDCLSYPTIISGNSSVGVWPGGPVNVSIRGNSIFGNGALGIKTSGLNDVTQRGSGDDVTLCLAVGTPATSAEMTEGADGVAETGA